LDGYTILILDFGGGTLDVSILKVKNGDFEVLAMHGKKWLGGRDLDLKIREEMVKRIKAQFNYEFTQCGECEPKCKSAEECKYFKQDMQELLEKCERLKIDLSSVPKSR
jgi:molecular chaperone DnaK